MSKRANPTVIGAFVVGAVVLVTAAVGVLGSGRFFRTIYPAVLFFEGDVNGLRVGAPVKFKGIQLGEVTSILLKLGDTPGGAEDKQTQLIPVFVSLDQANIVARGSTVKPDRETLAQFVKRGMRGQLKMESFVTGVLYVTSRTRRVRPFRPRWQRYRPRPAPSWRSSTRSTSTGW
jgi:paraquat-inducible protein B